MIFPEILKDYILEQKKIHKMTKKVMNGSETTQWINLKKFCADNSIDLSTVVNLGLKEIVYCIENDILPPKCHCGNKRPFSMGVYRPYCCMSCRNSDHNYGKKISKRKNELYSDPNWKTTTEEKRTATCLKRYNREYPMQVAEFYEKHERNSLQAKPYDVFSALRGYEPEFVDQIKKYYRTGVNVITGSAALKDHNIVINTKGKIQYPDFCIPSLALFIEVKSEYTFNNDLQKIIDCQDFLDEIGWDYVVIVIEPKKDIYEVVVDLRKPMSRIPMEEYFKTKKIVEIKC